MSFLIKYTLVIWTRLVISLPPKYLKLVDMLLHLKRIYMCI